MRLAILGLGLMGGSVARALRTRAPGAWTVSAWSNSGRGPAAAITAGAIDVAAPSAAEAIAGADVVLLAVPPLDCLTLIDELAGPLRASLRGGAVVTDVASTKRAIVERAVAARLPFVGGHPMTGRETSGFGASDAALFVDRPWVICPAGAANAAVERVEGLVRSVGGVPLRMDAREHDAAVAGISHLPLVLAAALTEAVLGEGSPHARALAASGWRDMTRLARGDPAMGAGIAATNADLISDAVRATRVSLDAWLADLERPGGPDAREIEARFAAARRLLDADPEGRNDGE
ncbi:MAG: prephenate dehydrogenase/arogenate dehydrogenase family protein [Chloroflexi bacterium]|nr:MAG: prephenate dehydrogenase/arogenate dehydrogenase family protein [Chloroflexota bacterium]